MHAQHITNQQLKETETITPYDTIIFGPMSLEKPNAGKPVQLFRGFYYYEIYLSTTGCLTGSPDREKYMATISLYLETSIQKTCSMKPSPA